MFIHLAGGILPRKTLKVHTVPMTMTKIIRVFNKFGYVVQDESGFKYHRRSQTKAGDDIYSCIERRKINCKARMKVRDDIIIVKMDEHNHEEVE